MKHIKTLFTVLVFSLGALVYTSSAYAANETATSELEITSNSGVFYKEALRPASLHIGVTLKSPYPENAQALPMKQVTIQFPSGLKFVPGNTPACTKINRTSNPIPSSMVQACPKSIIGNGGAGIYLARVNGPQPNLTDPVMIAFYGGKDKSGNPIIKIIGYSKNTGAGIYMEGAVKKDNTLTLNVPVLSYDSAVGNFYLDFPGKENPVPEYRSKITNFVQAKCAISPFKLGASFVMGTRNPTTGQDSSPNSYVSAPETTQDCVGAAGKAKSAAGLKGPAVAKAGQVKSYRITVRNPGTATLKGVRVKTTGKWLKGRSQSVGNLAPGASKTIVAKVRVLRSAKPKRATVLKARVSAGNSSAVTVTKRVRIK